MDVDLNGRMVTEGMAVAYRQYSRDYVPQEEQATVSKRGIWEGKFVYLRDWRRENRNDRTQPWSFKTAPFTSEAASSTQASGAASGQRLIKGNISRIGKRIYHMPGGYFYDRTVINETKGERWFCSEAAAQVAGWSAECGLQV